MNSRIKVDRLSVLPDNVKDTILTRLTIKEAVRISILSQGWRYQWHSLSKINIDRSDLLGVSQVEERVKIIDRILLLHCGSLDKFKVYIDFDTPTTDVDRWIIYLSRHGIKDLIIESSVGKYYNLPMRLFSCTELTYLQLTWCTFKPPPAAFKAFSNLTELFFVLVLIDNEVLEKLIDLCPLLSRLSLLFVHSCSYLRIKAPKLVMLRVSDIYRGFPLSMNTPLLESASFDLARVSVSNYKHCTFEFLHSMPLLQRLELKQYALQELAAGVTPVSLPFVCPVKHLILWINFKDLKEMEAAFCIFRSSPFIQILELTFFQLAAAGIYANAFWKGEEGLNLRFENLEEAKLTSFTGTKYELKFIEFLLAHAPALETMEIKFSNECKNVEGLFTMITKLACFPRASPKAKLVLPSNMSLILPSN